MLRLALAFQLCSLSLGGWGWCNGYDYKGYYTWLYFSYYIGNPRKNDNIFIICPDTVLDVNSGAIVDNIVNRNVTIQCGRDGSVENNCTIRGGSEASYFGHIVVRKTDRSSLVVRGVKFAKAEKVSVYVWESSADSYPPSIKFIDCVFEVCLNEVFPLQRKSLKGDPQDFLDSPVSHLLFLGKRFCHIFKWS